ncbi:MAG: hypothetical protein K9G33_07745 [Sneathiella sp.]|nr:hypothetical protein [Sneathiella sp.]
MNEVNQGNPPRDVLRDGNLKASVWRNESEKGPFYSVNLSRVYRDDQGDLRDSQSFATGDLLRVAELARKTYDRTQELRREDRQMERSEAKRSDAPLLDQDRQEQSREEFAARRTGSARSQKNPEHSR